MKARSHLSFVEIPYCLLIAIAIGACGGSSQPTVSMPAKLTITMETNVVQSGDFVQLTATPTDASGNPLGGLPGPVTWQSSDTAAARVRADGLLLALGPGLTTISAQSRGLSGSLPVNVNASPGAPGSVSFSFGPEEVVFTYMTDACEALDVPDVPARAVRLSDGTLMLVDGDAPHSYASFGADFSTLKRRCTAIYNSDDNTNPSSFDNQEWVQTVYRDGSVIHALIHNEFHDPVAPNCKPGDTSPANPCWYNSVTYASSTDNGQHFTHVAAPGHIVAPAASVWDATGSPAPYGYFEPSNIVKNIDGYYYAVFAAVPKGKSIYTDRAICLMRTKTLADPTISRPWDGTDFNLQMNDT